MGTPGLGTRYGDTWHGDTWLGDKVVAGTRELVSSTVAGAVGLARGAVRGGVDRTCSALSTGVGSVVGSRVGRLLATGVDAVLGKSEELVERYLPGRLEEPALAGARQHLHHMWLEWSQQDAVPMEESQVEARTLAMLRGLVHQLQAACTHSPHLATSARAFPSSVQETAGHVRHGVEGVQASLARAHSLHDLSDLVLEQSRETVTRAQLGIEELLEYVGQHTPLPWLVGPFAPVLVEYPEDVPVEMAKWEGCITVGGSHELAPPPQLCSNH
ncbi:PREDICTED: perilipin-3-like [Chaetura pelagica]|uniref:perilipin-3-like n=1 Tax=Chaetura pelagica TaxID=8897 RepID=UPI00052365C2|nr:PREDICTED: perilipin-3-like [Chaetura pelagica]